MYTQKNASCNPRLSKEKMAIHSNLHRLILVNLSQWNAEQTQIGQKQMTTFRLEIWQTAGNHLIMKLSSYYDRWIKIQKPILISDNFPNNLNWKF